jgi:hypothetical protein
MRVLAPGEPMPPAEALAEANDKMFAAFATEPAPPRDPAGWGYDLEGDYARPWLELARRFAQEGVPGGEQQCLRRVAMYAPRFVVVDKAHGE